MIILGRLLPLAWLVDVARAQSISSIYALASLNTYQIRIGWEFTLSLKEATLKKIASTISELTNSGRIKDLVSEALSEGISTLEIVEKGLRVGLDV